ncbi:MAG: hypothetical protein WC850_05275 [Candidatus Gracilibacteria bacterium]
MFKNEKVVETKTCEHCNKNFSITEEDLNFYDKISPKIKGEKFHLPLPKLCPDCRQQRRLSFMNYMSLYKSICDGCGNNIVSRFNPEGGINVYCNKCWASDGNDYLKYGINIDFNKSIFEQISYLIKVTPFQNLSGSLSNIKNNSIYTNHTADIHNCYMVFEADFVDDCMYGRGLRKSNNLIDCLNCTASEFCYECVDSNSLYNCFYTINSTSCNNSYYLKNCHGCSNCIGCVNLTNKSYYIFNKEVSKEEYKKIEKKISDPKFKDKIIEEFEKLQKKNNTNEKYIINSENCSYDYIFNSKNCINSYDITGCEDLRYCTEVNYSTDSMDINSYGSHSEHMYEGAGVGRYSRNLYFCAIIGKGEDLFYCIDVKKSKNCFACVNLKEKEYCILNKQYTKDEYEILVPKIINYMIKTGEWGEFFPSLISPFGYNETIANEYYPINPPVINDIPLNKRDNGNGMEVGGLFKWSTYEAPLPKVDNIILASKLPEDIKDIPDDILNWAIKCSVTNKPFRILKQELDFYRKHNLPIPKKHPDQRHLDRLALRNPRKTLG